MTAPTINQHANTTESASRTSTWTIDPAHTGLQFAVRHLMISTVRGRFGEVEGTLVLNDADPSKSTVEVSIPTNSIDTRAEQRDAHLRSPDFFDVERFPAITFRSKRIEGDITSGFKLTGDLTIRDVTREITLDVESNGRGRDPWGNEKLGFEARGKLSRGAFGLNWNQTLEAGGVLVGDEIKLELDVQFVRAS